MSDAHSDFGTPEMRNHTKLRLEARGVSDGGRIITTGYRNEIPDLLEFLYDQGSLKAFYEHQAFADTRVANGRAFQELYQFWHSKGKDLAAHQMVVNIIPTLEGHVGSPRDIAETVYNEVMRVLGKRGRVAYQICIEGTLRVSNGQIRASLDALPRAMESAREIVEKRLK